MKYMFRRVAVVALALLPLWAQEQGGSSSAAPTSPQTDSVQIIGFLDKAISWYRQLPVQQQLATEPEDIAFFQENRRMADEVVQQAFSYARQQADTRGRQTPQRAQGSDAQQYPGLAQAVGKTQQDIQDTQTELQATRNKLANARPSKRQSLQAQVAELESEVGLLEARYEALQSMLEFVSASNSGKAGVGLRAQIDELARSVPASLSGAQGANREPEQSASYAQTNTSVRKPEPTGIWGLIATSLHLSSKMHSLDDQIRSTNDLSHDAEALRQPTLDYMRGLIHQGDVLFAAADTASPAQLTQQKQQLDALTAEFKATSAAMLPMSKIGILLDSYQRNLTNWRESVKGDLDGDLRELLFRLIVLGALIGIVIGVSELWRRATFRYVRDTRRRYQFLLLRRIAIWITIAIIVVFTFASQLGSAVTFAGLITAGVAVALQNVILSVVAYFFLIGKYGIRVGDRVQIAGVTGEVVELGLVRIHLMEMEGQNNSQPTGRTVAFSNSIVFQPTSGVFKQVPGTNFVWHEIKLTLAPDTDYHAARERITGAVETALAEYGQTMDAQREVMARHLSSVAPAEFRPKMRLRYAGTGIEATVNFPADFQKASEMHDRVMKEIMVALARDPKIKLLGAEAPSAKASD